AGTFNILVATDIAARGIDVSGISHVINYDMPDTVETYTHRVGRTGRAEQTGDAYTFATSEDLKMVRSVERSLGKSIPRKQVSGLTSLAKISTKTNGKKSNPSSSRTSFDFGISAR
ncbi:MAG: hypothetical protein D3911_12885, partial [Candidatus Electrothrix sp. AW3_4]|nr:hypothetical protein [Candidatus Electrothrix gigas]